MKLYTINATPVKTERSEENNHLLMMGYPSVVAKTLASFGIDGFTMYQVNGYWMGVKEPSFKIEVALDEGDEMVERKTIRDIAERLRDEYSQDAVMITWPNNQVDFI